jgi:hypothetical protein
MLGKHETQLGHPAAQTWRLFYQVNFQARISQIQGSAHTADASTDDQNGRRSVGSGSSLLSGLTGIKLHGVYGEICVHAFS